MKKALSLFCALFVFLTMLAGCSVPPSQSTSATTPATTGASSAAATTSTTVATEPLSGKFTMWWWTEDPKMADGFKAAYPTITMETVLVDAGDYLTKIQSTLASGGKLPDVLLGEILFRGKLFEMGILDDLSQAPYNFDRNKIVNYLIPTMTNDKGQILGVETSQNPAALAYRRDLAKEYLGTDDRTQLEAMFKDWDAFISKGKEVVTKSKNKVYMMPSLGDVYYIINGQSRTPRIAGNELNTAAVTDIMTSIAKFRDAGIIDKIVQWTPAWFSSYGTGKSIFFPTACWGVDNFIKPNDPDGKGNWGLMLPPGGGFSWGGTTMSITKSSKNKELAWKLVEWYNLLPGGSEAKKAVGVIPVLRETASDPAFANNVDPFFGDENIGKLWMEQVIPTIHINQITPYDAADIMAFELVLSSMNADYSITAEKAVAVYKEEMLTSAPELNVK